MAIGTRFISPDQQFISFNGLPYAGGKLFFYISETSTPTPTYSDQALTIPNPNPIILDSAGNSGNVFLNPNIIYKVVLEDANGDEIWTFDPVDPVAISGGSSTYSWAGFSGGSANAQTLIAASFSYGDGQLIAFIPSNTNTAPLTIAVNGGAATNVDVDLGSGPRLAPAGVVRQNNVVLMVYDATNSIFHILNPFPNLNPIVNVAAASTTDLGSASSNFVNVTGATTINSFGSSAGLAAPIFWVKFTGINSIVNSGNIVIPGGANLTTGAGDTAIMQYTGGGTWTMLFYQSASSAVGNGTTGQVGFFATPTAPAGWLPCDGAIYSISSHPVLFGVIGTTFGGDGISTFGVPDMRGQFARGWDNGAGVDPGRVFGSQQGDLFAQHTHLTSAGNLTVAVGLGAGAGVNFSVGFPSQPSGGSETRPKNVALLACIKT